VASSDTMDTQVGTWHSENVLKRLDRSRRFLYGQGIITETVNEAVRKSLEEARDLELAAEHDHMADIPAHLVEEDEPEPGDE